MVGLAGDGYEPNYEWFMPAAVLGVGVAIGSWWVLWLALLPLIYALPEGTGGDPPAIPAALIVGSVVAGLLALGVFASKAMAAAAQIRKKHL